ncbi:unnamed protein product [Clonostachys rosea]|uniref:Fumarylacetoacetase n=1 Tax=Bionectria ochroleuca TaxID=29856 RepID=A0ABY6U0M1_BIOOC|nr:unnamed protein product [Clonostachys rosea]
MNNNIDIPNGSPFSIHNIPFGVISTRSNEAPRCAVAIGDYAIDLDSLARTGCLDHAGLKPSASEIFAQPNLNRFAALGRQVRREVRENLIRDITKGEIPHGSLHKLVDVKMHLPFRIGGFSDFYCSLEHVHNCSDMTTRASIPENWFYAPSVYNSRVSSIIPSPQPVRRPNGMFYNEDKKPTYGPSQEVDYELEMGVFVSKPIPFGSTLDIKEVEEHIFGFVMLNDWSARDLQVFEMKPLGPFHAKGFGTSISPWVVTMDALEPFRCTPKTVQDPVPPRHLRWPGQNGTFDIRLRADLLRKGMQMNLGTSNLRYLYWTPFQQLAHHASAMCGIGTGDLIGTGTISGDGEDGGGNKTELGCLYEATRGGSRAIRFSDGTSVKYLQDGDEIILSGTCGNASGGGPYLGFGECRGALLPAFGGE